MSAKTEITEYVAVHERVRELDCDLPQGIVFLPANFQSAKSADEFMQDSAAATVRTLFRNAEIPHGDILKDGRRLPSIQNNSVDWVAPTLFLGASMLTENPDLVNVALSVVANYLTDFFKGSPSPKTIKLELVVEKEKDRSCTKISYEGSVEGLGALPEIVKQARNE